MITLGRIIDASKVTHKDKKKEFIYQLSVLNGLNSKDVFNYSLDRLNELVDSSMYVYDEKLVVPVYEFRYKDKSYNLPTNLASIPYIKWEDITVALDSDVYGSTTLEKLPYILSVLLYEGDYIAEDGSNKCLELSKYWLDLDGKTALGLLSFFLLRDKISYVTSQVYLQELSMKRRVIHLKTRLLRHSIRSGSFIQFVQLLPKIRGVQF